MPQNRRDFITSAAAAGLGLALSERSWAQEPAKQDQKVRFACIGVGGKGDSDTADAARLGEIVAICDIDDDRLERAAAKYPNAKKFNDYRKCLEEVGKDIDAVTVSTPDHMHGSVASMAMLMGKHCFCQKPLTRTLYEARRLAEIAKKMKVQTQMGNQGTADSGLRKRAMEVRAGLLGKVTELHVWTNRPIWPQGMERSMPIEIPETIHWDLWLGVAPERPFARGYHSFAWRGWWDFGSGALGDMGCHTLNMPYMALDLRDPKTVQAETGPNNGDSFPAWSIVTYEFDKGKHHGPIKLVWYDGGKKPPMDLMAPEWKMEDSGSLLIGDKGKLYLPGDYGGGGFLKDGVDVGEVPFEVSPGHFAEFIRAIKEGKPAMSNFPDYAGPLAEMVLCGNLAVRAGGKKVEWDAKHLKAKNAPELADYIHPKFRDGWTTF